MTRKRYRVNQMQNVYSKIGPHNQSLPDSVTHPRSLMTQGCGFSCFIVSSSFIKSLLSDSVAFAGALKTRNKNWLTGIICKMSNSDISYRMTNSQKLRNPVIVYDCRPRLSFNLQFENSLLSILIATVVVSGLPRSPTAVPLAT